jgi:hypothetical protein
MSTDKDFKDFIKNEWIEVKGGENYIDHIIMENKIKSEGIRHVINIFKNDRFMLSYIYISNELLRLGMKVAEIDLRTCLILENIEAKIGISEYEQPFPTMGIKIPEEYREVLRRRIPGASIPEFMIIHLGRSEAQRSEAHNSIKFVIASCWLGNGKPILGFFICNRTLDIDETMVKFVDELKGSGDRDYEAAKFVLRIGVNLMMLMVDGGKRELGRKNEKRYRALKREGRIIIDEPVFFELKQELSLFRKVNKDFFSSRGERNSPKPHWRHGYIRRQRYGKGLELIKRIYIMPVFVMSENYKGDMSDTEVVFKEDGRSP